MGKSCLNKTFERRLGNHRFPPEVANSCAARGAGSRGEAPVPFLSPFLCGTTKKWHQSPHSERAQQCEPVGKVVKNPVFNPPINQNLNHCRGASKAPPPTGFEGSRFVLSTHRQIKIYTTLFALKFFVGEHEREPFFQKRLPLVLLFFYSSTTSSAASSTVSSSGSGETLVKPTSF